MDRQDLIDGLIDDAMSVLHHDGTEGGDVDAYERETLGKKFAARLGIAGFKFIPRVERNQVVTPAQAPGADDRALELVDGADDVESLGPAAVISPYRKPADPRVKGLLRDAERQRAAEAARTEPPERKIYTDPRLDPTYRPPKKPTS